MMNDDRILANGRYTLPSHARGVLAEGTVRTATVRSQPREQKALMALLAGSILALPFVTAHAIREQRSRSRFASFFRSD